MSELKWITLYQIIVKESILFIHKTIFDNQPKAITEFLTYSLSNKQNIRATRKTIVIDDHKSNKAKNSLIYKGNYLYNRLPNEIKNKNPRLMSKYLQKNISDHFPCDRIEKYDHG